MGQGSQHVQLEDGVNEGILWDIMVRSLHNDMGNRKPYHV